MAPSLRNLAVFHSPSLTIEHEIEISHAGHWEWLPAVPHMWPPCRRRRTLWFKSFFLLNNVTHVGLFQLRKMKPSSERSRKYWDLYSFIYHARGLVAVLGWGANRGQCPGNCVQTPPVAPRQGICNNNTVTDFLQWFCTEGKGSLLPNQKCWNCKQCVKSHLSLVWMKDLSFFPRLYVSL